jgi:glycine cleavage system H lipoate-binding protein
MQPPDIITLYATKPLEYLVALSFLLLFVPFWRYVSTPVAETVKAAQRAAKGTWHDWFRVPDDVLLHPGHGWARVESPGVVVAGLDQFAQQLVGPIESIQVPWPGDSIQQGERGWSLKADSKSVDMLAPVSGRVLAVNDEVRRNPALLAEDPYGRGWLVKVQSPSFETCRRHLLRGGAARHLVTSSWEDLCEELTPELGHVLQDGGVPVHGLARAVDEEHWDQIARRALLTERRQS